MCYNETSEWNKNGVFGSRANELQRSAASCYNRGVNYIARAKKFRTKKRLGQNFLVDESVIEEILSNVGADDNVLEIGSGIGFVTEGLVGVAKSVRAIELDEDAIKILKATCHEAKIIHQDILKTDLSALLPVAAGGGRGGAAAQKFKVIANIPYYITSPILVHLLGEIDEAEHKNRAAIDEIILMVQLEVAKRLVASENSPNKEYGMLSILAQFYADVEIIRTVKARSFYPAPKVDSALVRLKIRPEGRVEVNPFLKRTVKAAFATRRKNIKNSLMQGGFLNVEKVLAELGIDQNIRGEKLSIEQFERLSRKLYENQG